MARPIDHARRTELLDAAVDYVMANGLADLSLRPIAAALGVTTPTLAHHFGTREELIQAITGRARERIFVATSGAAGTWEHATMGDAARAIWAWSSAPEQEAMFRFFFGVYGYALHQPERLAEFRERVVEDWLEALDAAAPSDASQKTLLVATIRGLLIDLLATGDRERVQRAFDAWVERLEPAP